jgi:hypothetical protein
MMSHRSCDVWGLAITSAGPRRFPVVSLVLALSGRQDVVVRPIWRGYGVARSARGGDSTVERNVAMNRASEGEGLKAILRIRQDGPSPAVMLRGPVPGRTLASLGNVRPHVMAPAHSDPRFWDCLGCSVPTSPSRSDLPPSFPASRAPALSTPPGACFAHGILCAHVR